MSYKILIVDDDKGNLKSTKIFLENYDYHVDNLSSGKSAIDLLRIDPTEYAVILMDYYMPELNGVETSKEILKLRPQQLIAMYSCDDDKTLVKEAMRIGIVDYIEKEMLPSQFLNRIQQLCKKYEQTFKPIVSIECSSGSNQELISSVGMVGASMGLAKVAQDIKLFANSKQTVLIIGETGTGKEEVAKAIHRLSSRSNQPFITLDCTTIPDTLMESTLYGHTKGSFTGAIKDQVGKFTFANRGTLFLDEIGELPLQLQAKFLRVLQEKTVEPVGSNRNEKVDVRIIAATQRNLEEMVKAGTFREDLYYRLKVLNIYLPPLRERVEDIEPLIAHFSELLEKTEGIKRRFAKGALPKLMDYPWSGNIRELKHVVDSTLTLGTKQVVGAESLARKFFDNYKSVSSDELPNIQALEQQQQNELVKYIKEHLKKARSKSEASKRMGISPSRLHYYIENYGIKNEPNA